MPQSLSPNEPKSRRYYETLYQSSEEPWNYRDRGVEILRHDAIIRVLSEIRPRYANALDIGCSLGQLTRKLAALTDEVFAFDISETAVRKARSQSGGVPFHFFIGTLPGLALVRSKLELILACDCIHEFVPEARREAAVREIRAALAPNGLALFCDYMRPGKEAAFRELLEKSDMEIVRIYRMYDRVWYQFESWFKGVREWSPVKKMLGQIWIARALRLPARALGRLGSTHVLFVAAAKK